MNPEKAARLDVPENMFALLKSGEEVELPNGRRVQPAEVMSQPQPGRMLHYGTAYGAAHEALFGVIHQREGTDSVKFDPEENPDNQVETSHFFRLIDV